jgi:hypothetical protein
MTKSGKWRNRGSRRVEAEEASRLYRSQCSNRRRGSRKVEAIEVVKKSRGRGAEAVEE